MLHIVDVPFDPLFELQSNNMSQSYQKSAEFFSMFPKNISDFS